MNNLRLIHGNWRSSASGFDILLQFCQFVELTLYIGSNYTTSPDLLCRFYATLRILKQTPESE